MKYDILPTGFKIRSGEVNVSRIPHLTQRIIAFLDKSPFRELFTSKDLAARLGVRLDTMRDAGNHSAATEYKIVGKTNSLLWGSKKTIREFKRLRAKQNED